MKRAIIIGVTWMTCAPLLCSQDLSWLLQQAAEHNPDLQSIQLTYEAEINRITAVGALPDPEIAVEIFPMSMQRFMGSQIMDITVRQKFPWKGTLKAASETARQQAQGQLSRYEQVKSMLTYDISREWWMLQILHKKSQFLNRHLEILNLLRDLLSERIANGLGEATQLLELKLKENEKVNLLENIRQQIKISEGTIRQLAKTPDWIFSPSGKIQLVAFPIIPLDQSLPDNPQIRHIVNEQKVFEAMEQWNILKGKPTFGVGLQYGILAKADRPDLNPTMNGRNMLMPMVSMSLPLNRKKYTAPVQEMKLMQVAKVKEMEGLNDDLLNQIGTENLNYENAVRELKFFEDQITLLKELEDLQVAEFANGKGGLEKVLVTRQRLIDNQIQMLNTHWTAITAVLKVEQILGR